MSDPDLRHRDGLAWRRAGAWALLPLLLLYLGLAAGSAAQKSVTVDELGHLPSGVYFLQSGDPRYAALNPPLLNALSALPVLLLDLEQRPEPPAPADDPFSFWENGYVFQESHRGDYRRIFDAARWVPMLGVAALAVLLFVFGRRLAPEDPELAGLLAAGLLCLSPNVLAQARLVGTDTGTAALVALAVFSLRAMLERPDPLRILLCGAALGLAQLTKFYALLLYPAFAAATFAWHALASGERPPARRLWLSLLAAVVISGLVVNAGYLGRELGASLSTLSLKSPSLVVWQESWLGEVPLPLPGAYVRAFDGQLVERASSLPSFLFGERFEGGRWYFYLGLLAVKTPPALLLAFGMAAVLSCGRARLPAREWVLLLGYPALLFVLLSASSGRQLGIRALLSAAPLVWCFAGATLARAGATRAPVRALAALALFGTATSAVLTHPHYLSYFNLFAGGREQGYRLASEANVDVGQDLEALAAYLEDEGVSRVQLLYFGSVDPALYGIDYEVPTGPLEPGLLAVSVSLYHTAYPMYDHGRLHTVGPVEVRGLGEPIASLGGSIHVYRVAP